LQRSLLPAALAVVPGVEIGAYEAAGEGLDDGGDFYDVFAVDDRRWRLAVRDVSGNGPKTAAATGLPLHALHLLARQERPLAGAVAQLNQAILDQEGQGPVPHHAATLSYVWHADEGQLDAVRAAWTGCSPRRRGCPPARE
jgi:serine phosphatase RsbU (regulator of sigma subunit)